MDRTVCSMLTTSAFLRPMAGTTPLPTMVRLPSRATSPIRAHILLVPTSIPTSTASRSTRSRPRWWPRSRGVVWADRLTALKVEPDFSSEGYSTRGRPGNLAVQTDLSAQDNCVRVSRADIGNQVDPGDLCLAPVGQGRGQVAHLRRDDGGHAHGRGVEPELSDPAGRDGADGETVVVIHDDGKRRALAADID